VTLDHFSQSHGSYPLIIGNNITAHVSQQSVLTILYQFIDLIFLFAATPKLLPYTAITMVT